MSEATFTQSSSPTTGLTNYDLEPGPKELYPAPVPGRQKRKRLAAWRARYLTSGRTKGHPTMTKNTIEAMVETLSKSVASIVASNAANRDELLSKSFTEFSAALIGEVDTVLAKAAQSGEEPLFKGLGAVGRIANLVSTLANNIKSIQNGYESWQVGQNNSVPPDADPASPEVVEHLEDLLSHAEFILRCAVNEHCEPMEDGEDAGHHMIVMVPMGEDGEDGEMAVKCDLPEELAKYATDPAQIANMLADHSFGLLEKAGIDTEALSKAISNEGLAKDFSGSAAPDAGGAAADPAMPEGMGDEDPLTTLGRLAALMMIQIDYIQQQVDGTNEPSDPTGEDTGASGDDAGGSPVATAEANEDSPAAKADGAGDLAKIAASMDDATLAKVLKDKGIDLDALAKLADENAALQARVEETEALAKQALAQPQAPKAPLFVAGTVAKGAEDGISPQQPEQDLSKLDPMARALELTKRQHQVSGKPLA